MAIPSVVQGMVKTADGKVFELDSSKGSTWIEAVNSFKFVPTGVHKPYTVRKELGKGGKYWYGYRRVAGKLQKKYIGRSSDVTTAKLEEIAEALDIPPQARVTNKVTERVTEVAEKVAEVPEVANRVTDKVTQNDMADRLTVLEFQVQALQESLEALRDRLPEIENVGNFSELPKPEIEVTESELPNELGNLEVENEKLKVDYASLLESSTVITNKLRQELAEARSQLETERADQEQVEVELAELQQNSATASKDLPEARSQLETERADREQVEVELAELQQNSATASKDLPEAADLLNQLKAKRRKSTVSLADVETLLEIIEKSCDELEG